MPDVALPKTYRKLVATFLTTEFRAAAKQVEVAMPTPRSREVLIRNRFAGVNASDVNLTAGRYFPNPNLPMDLGFEAAGEVVALGKDINHLKLGDAVVTTDIGAGYREYYLTKATRALPVPVASPEALSLAVSGLTASVALHEVGGMGSGETILVTAAAGGTGQYAVQLAKLAGNHVIGTCGSDEKAALLKSLGCDRAINYRTENVRAVLKKEYPDGINLIYESVGGTLFDTCVGALARRGRLLSIGYISEYLKGMETVEAPRLYHQLLAKSASVQGFFLPHYAEHFRTHTIRLMNLMNQGNLKALIDPTPFKGLDAVADAVDHLHAGKNRGKVVVQL